MVGTEEVRTYLAKDCIAFRKTNEAFGGLSNMAPGFPIKILGTKILTAEALYQACRFPGHPALQYDIIAQHSPMCAKDLSRRYQYLTRPDWEDVRVKIMKWSLRAKLLCNWDKFGELLKSTGTKIIVEDSSRDLFWGAARKGLTYTGVNALGRLLMELRGQYLELERRDHVQLLPLNIPDFLLLGQLIEPLSYKIRK